MSLSYPIADNGMEALTDPKGWARTKSGAKRESGQAVQFETEWLRPGPSRAEEIQSAVHAAISTGSVQVYESEKGKPVIAVSYWKLVAREGPEPVRPMIGESKVRPTDHADDLYFRHGRTKKRRPKPVDPNQMDLFGKPENDETAN